MRSWALVCVASSILGGLVSLALFHALDGRRVSANDRLPAPMRRGGGVWNDGEGGDGREPPVPFTPDEMANIAVYESANRGVVNINTKTRSESLLFFEFQGEGAGSGLVLDQQGDILTNYHVVEGAKTIQVTLYDGKNYEARLLGSDPASDVAVLRIDAPVESLHPLELGESSSLLVGQRVFAIGNPFGLERTLTTGIISSLNRTLPARNGRTIKSVIQIDAAINPGSSGGPLLDSRGKVIGINTAIASATGQNTGVGFAVPVNTITRVVPQLITRGRVVRPEIGIGKVFQTEQGLLVATLVPGGPAEQSGLRGPKITRQKRGKGPFSTEKATADLRSADLIVGVDAETVKTADDFLSAIESRQPGDEVVLLVVRDGKSIRIPVRLAPGE